MEEERDLYRPQVLEDRTFTAGERRILWRIQVLKMPRGYVMVRLSRVGRRVVNIMFSWEEVTDLVKHLNAVRKVNLEGKEAE